MTKNKPDCKRRNCKYSQNYFFHGARIVHKHVHFKIGERSSMRGPNYFTEAEFFRKNELLPRD